MVWGKEIVSIRDDFIMLRQQFWDQAGVLVKVMETTEIALMDARSIASRMRMFKVATPTEWTEMVVETVDFDVTLADNLFTLSNLRNPRQ